MSESVFSFFKQNVGEEDVIKLLLMSAGKALVTVAILICALLASFKLSEWYGFGFVALLTITFSILMLWSCMYIFGMETTHVRSQFDLTKYKTWSHVCDNLLPLNKLFYFDEKELRNSTDTFVDYIVAWTISSIAMCALFGVGVIATYIYAIIVALFESTTLSPEFLYIAIPCTLSVLIMSALFLKLKWRKIWMVDGVNWNLAAWCICAAVIITTMSFVAGVAIRRIAGFIGIEYTIILVTSYVIITATYVYLDLKQWMINKSRLAAETTISEVKPETTSP